MCGRGFAPRICSCSHQICYPELNRDCRFYKMQKFMRLPFPPPHIYRRLKNRHRKEPCAGPAPKPDGSSRFFSPTNLEQPRPRHHRQIPAWDTSKRGAGGHKPVQLAFPWMVGGALCMGCLAALPLSCCGIKVLTFHLLHIPAFPAAIYPAYFLHAKWAAQAQLCQELEVVFT